jgi:hypothetical protein
MFEGVRQAKRTLKFTAAATQLCDITRHRLWQATIEQGWDTKEAREAAANYHKRLCQFSGRFFDALMREGLFDAPPSYIAYQSIANQVGEQAVREYLDQHGRGDREDIYTSERFDYIQFTEALWRAIGR